MCGRFALSLAPHLLERRARDEWTPDLQGWQRSADETQDEQGHRSGSDEAPEAGPSQSSSGKTSSTSKKAALPFEHGYRVGNYNVSPSTNVPVVYRAEISEGSLASPTLLSMKWGLVPSWMKEPPEHSSSLRTINARDDTVLSGSGLWKGPRGKRRCVIMAEGFYEWQKRGGDKIPHFVKRKDGRLMCMAGLYDIAHLKDRKEPLYSFTIITTDNNPQLAFLHDRMPVILSSVEHAQQWLDTTSHEFTEDLAKLLKPYNGELECYPVPKEVGKTSENSPDFVHPVSERKGNIASFFQKQASQSPAKGKAESLKPGSKPDSAKRKAAHKQEAPKHDSAGPNDDTPTTKGIKRSHSPSQEDTENTLSHDIDASGNMKLNDAALKAENKSFEVSPSPTGSDSDIELVAESSAAKSTSQAQKKKHKKTKLDSD